MEDFADDDFGELYAETTPAPLYIEAEEEEEDDDDDGDNGDAKNNDATGGKKEVNDDYVGSDSEDDLNIVLNDEDCLRNGVVVAGVGSGCDEDVHGDDDGFAVGSERGNSNAHVAHSKNDMIAGYGSQYFRRKYMQTRGSMFVSNIKANKSRGLASYWGIFDVNIDTSEEKPWTIPGVDITDYFNFGFNEDTWKLYCAPLEQLWRTSVHSGIPVNESAKLNQEAMREQIDQVVSVSLHSPSSECKVPKGRAIQVEDSMVERQPSIDVRRPRSRDSDVIIQIEVHECSDEYSGSVNSNVLDASEEGEFVVGNNGNILSSSSEHDVLSKEKLEDVTKSGDSSVQERNDTIPGVDKDERQEQVDQHSEGIAEVPEGETKTEGVGIDTCSADPFWIESELSLGDQELSLTSYPDSDFEGTEGSVHVDNEKSHSPLRRHSVNSDTDLKESLPLYHKTSKNNSFNRKPVNIAYYSRNGGRFRQELRHQSGRHKPGYKLNMHIENDNGASHVPMSSARDFSLLGRQFVNYDRQKDQLQSFGSHKRRYVSYNRETKQPCYYGGEKFVDDLGQTVYTKDSYRKFRDSFRENTNYYVRKNEDQRGSFFEQRTLIPGNEDSERDWYHADSGHFADDLSPFSYKDSRKFLPNYSSFPAKERDTPRPRMRGKPHFRDRNCDDDQWFDHFDECEFEFLNRSYRMSTSSAEREMESLCNEYEGQFPHIERELKRSAKRVRCCDRPPLVLDNLCSENMEGECQKYTHHQASNLKYCRQSYTDSARNYVYGTRVNEKLGGCGRHKHARANRGSDWCCGYADAGEDENSIIYPVKEHDFYCPPSKVLHLNEDEVIFRHQGELHAEEDTFSYEETPRHERHAKYGYLQDKLQIDDIKMQQHQLTTPRRDSDRFLKGSSKIMRRGKHKQVMLRCRKSVNLVNRKEKVKLGKLWLRSCTAVLIYMSYSASVGLFILLLIVRCYFIQDPLYYCPHSSNYTECFLSFPSELLFFWLLN